MKTKFIILISTQCKGLGGRGERNLGRRGRSRKEIWRNPGSFLAPLCTAQEARARPQSGPRSRFTDSWWRDCTSPPPRQLPPKPWWRCPAPAKAMTQFSRKSLKVKVQWTWAPRPLPPSTMPSTIPLSQATPHPIHPTIPSKQQSLNKSNICSLKQALEEYCNAQSLEGSLYAPKISQHHQHHYKLSCWKHRELSNDTRRMSQNGQISKCQLETSKRCHLELHDAWTPLDKFCIDKAEKALSITKILADILSLNYKDICGFLSQIFYAVLFAAGFTASEL